MRCYFNVRSSNLIYRTETKTKKWKNRYAQKYQYTVQGVRGVTSKKKQMTPANVSGDYLQEFVTVNETGIDISWTVVYYHKFHNRNKKTHCISSAGMFAFADINHWDNVYFSKTAKIFSATAAKSALSRLTDKCRIFA